MKGLLAIILIFAFANLANSQSCGASQCGADGNSAFKPIHIEQNGFCIDINISCCDKPTEETTTTTEELTTTTEEPTTTTEEPTTTTDEPTTTTEEPTTTTEEPTTTTEEPTTTTEEPTTTTEEPTTTTEEPTTTTEEPTTTTEEPTTTTEEPTTSTEEPTTTTEEPTTAAPPSIPAHTTVNADGCASCDNESYGTLVHHKDCTKFCTCQWYDHQGRNVIKDCPAGLYFDYGLQRCEWPILSDCPYK